MSADVSTYHGGDGVGTDPPDPSRVPPTCQTAPPPRRKGRGLATNLDVEQRRRDAGKPLPLKLDAVTGKVVGKESSAFVRQMGVEVTITLPGHYLNFSEIPQHFKDQIVQKMKVKHINKFNVSNI